MDCNVIIDLLPLYADGCCSEESVALVETHLKSCKDCKNVLDSMKGESFSGLSETMPEVKISRISQFKASLLQSVLLFLSFAAITLGVTFEATTPMGVGNGNWAFMLIIPATAFMLSLANWYFVRLYKSKGVFSTFSMIITLGLAICGFVWGVLHYGNLSVSFVIGAVVTLVLCILSKILSSLYAKALGKQ
ncbi:MAG: zf-HC2 domain-containing protein [Ruminococcus sp.]|nr:zf-HC2 domain-containing protein [Ruminococcus sp.]